MLVRLREEPVKPLLPSIFLSNVRSLANKTDDLRLQVATHDITKDSFTVHGILASRILTLLSS